MTSGRQLRLTAEKLADLTGALVRAIRPFIGLTRDDPPPEARPVHLDFKGVPAPGGADHLLLKAGFWGASDGVVVKL